MHLRGARPRPHRAVIHEDDTVVARVTGSRRWFWLGGLRPWPSCRRVS